MDSSLAHFLAGGVGGTVGAILTCPLEVVKIRLQSSHNVFFTTPLATSLHADNIDNSARPASPLSRHQHTNNSSCSSANSLRALPSCTAVSSKCTTSLPRPHLAPSMSCDRRSIGGLLAHNSSTLSWSHSLHCKHLHSPLHMQTRIPSTDAKGDITASQPQPSPQQNVKVRRSMSIFDCMRRIVQQEGVLALYKGIGPTLIGVLPSRATYFFTYHTAQVYLCEYFESTDSPLLTISSACCGGLVSSTLTSPIWYVKTRLQLDTRSTTAFTIIRETFERYGFRGFFRGLQASYFGINETAVNFLIYESIKRHLLDWEHERCLTDRDSCVSVHDKNDRAPPTTKLHKYSDMYLCMLASACSKSFSITMFYPHEVARTRLREDGNRYKRFLQTLRLVVEEEGYRGLYRGLVTHYARQIPNSCITIGVYEVVVYLLNDWNLISGKD